MPERSPQRTDRPAKPYPGFPLFPHATGRWAKKIHGRFGFFGPWRDAEGALERYLHQRDELHAGLVPRTNGAGTGRATLARTGRASAPAPVFALPARPDAARGLVAQPAANGVTPPLRLVAGDGTAAIPDAASLTVRDLVNHFLTAKQRRIDSEEMGLRSFSEYPPARCWRTSGTPIARLASSSGARGSPSAAQTPARWFAFGPAAPGAPPLAALPEGRYDTSGHSALRR
jgi:hypothetical protein